MLVTGGAGAVAFYVIQLAKIRGAHVITTVSSDIKAAHARTAGADEIINYRSENVAERVKALAPAGVDAVIDLDINVTGPLLPQIVRPHGIVVVYGVSDVSGNLPVRFFLFNNITLKFMLVYELAKEDLSAAIEGVTQLLETGVLKHALARRYPLEQIAAAHKAVEDGEVIGKVIVDIRSASA